MLFDKIEVRNGFDVLNEDMTATPSGRFDINFKGELLRAPADYTYDPKLRINDSLEALVSVSGNFVNYGGGDLEIYKYDYQNDVVGDFVVSAANLVAPDFNFVFDNIESNQAYVARISGNLVLVNGDPFFFTNSDNMVLTVTFAPDENFVPFDHPAGTRGLSGNIDVTLTFANYSSEVVQVFQLNNETGEETYTTESTPISNILNFSLTANTLFVFKNLGKRLSVDGDSYLFTSANLMNVNLA